MNEVTTRQRLGNGLLSALPGDDFARIAAELTPVTLSMGARLASPRTSIEYVYCVKNGIVSVVAERDQNRGIEVGIIGLEGVAGLPVLLGVSQKPQSGDGADAWQRLANAGNTALRGGRCVAGTSCRFASICARVYDPDCPKHAFGRYRPPAIAPGAGCLCATTVPMGRGSPSLMSFLP